MKTVTLNELDSKIHEIFGIGTREVYKEIRFSELWWNILLEEFANTTYLNLIKFSEWLETVNIDINGWGEYHQYSEYTSETEKGVSFQIKCSELEISDWKHK